MHVRISVFAFLFLPLLGPSEVLGQYSQQQLNQWLKRFPQADTDGDGRLSLEEAAAYRKKLMSSVRGKGDRNTGAPRSFQVDPGWDEERFPEEAVCYRTPEEIAEIYPKIVSYQKPTDGSLRIVGTGHSFMAPGYKTFPLIARAAGLEQPPLLTNVSGGMRGSARYKWEEENGIFQFSGDPRPKLLASICNAEWDAMMWGPYFNDRPAYYRCWIDFCRKYNPEMTFYVSDAWPQLYQLDELPDNEDELASQIVRMGEDRNAETGKIVEQLNRDFPGSTFIMPTCDAMVIAAEHYQRGELPGVQGIHKLIGKKQRSMWVDHLGHLGPGFGQLEGYVFYATMYGRSPELIEAEIFEDDYPSAELDRVFRKIAWKAALKNPHSGITDKNGNGVDDDRE